MNDYQEVFGKLETAIEGIESLKKSAYKQYSTRLSVVKDKDLQRAEKYKKAIQLLEE